MHPLRRNAFSTTALMAGVGAMAGCALQPTAPPAPAAEAPVATAAAVQVYAAGSLRDVLTEITRDHEARTGQKVVLTFGASGLLRDRIERGTPAGGAPAQVFASADTEHPQRLANQGQWQAPAVFTRNTLCALAQGTLPVTPESLLATLLQPQVRLGISTPKADPSGDYAWELFRRADALQPGATVRLQAKALQLTGAADSLPAPAGRNTYAWVMEQNRADVFLTYCTNAVAARAELPRLQVVAIPDALQVGAAYGVTVRADAPANAQAFAKVLLQPPAQSVFRRLGFAAP